MFYKHRTLIALSLGLLVSVLVFNCTESNNLEEKVDGGADSDSDSGTKESIRVIAIGDLHGDLDAAVRALRTGGVIDENNDWIGKETVVVQIGDILDRRDDERAIIDMFEQLKEGAKAEGGQIITLNGNHEIFTAGGYYFYATEGACEDFVDIDGLKVDRPEFDELSENCKKRAAAFWPGGPYAKILSTWPVWTIVDDSVFVHGGLLQSHLDFGLDRVNQDVEAWLAGHGDRPNEEMVGYKDNSMVWTGVYGEPEVSKADCNALDLVLSQLGVSRMVVGHMVQETFGYSINSACSGSVWRIDIGMSSHWPLGGVQVLEIEGGEMTILSDVGTDADTDTDTDTDTGYESRIIAIGDHHGDMDATRKSLEIAGLIDDDNHWAGKNTILVQVGDVLDRGDDERDIFDLYVQLKEEAEAAGGQVVNLNGNHETMTVHGNYQDMFESACDAFSDLDGLDTGRIEWEHLSENCKKRAAAFAPGGPYAKILAEWPVSAIIENIVFVHGGLLPAHLEYGLENADEDIHAWMLGQGEEPMEITSYPDGMVWSRVYGEYVVGEGECDQLESMLDELGVETMVVGHSPQVFINSACDGVVWRVDTGMADYYGGNTMALEILNGEMTILYDKT
ncbi:MAG: hypothetical protein GY854_03725 [Deltaproteobacteria bacterium]|nr:hypothetical protein [Deltaproteobacteria bacterium]